MSFRIETTRTFDAWLDGLRDRVARAVIARRIQRVATGNLGDVRSLGAGVSELRIQHGPGYRVYFSVRREVLVVLLCGGDKSSQARDIARAKALAKDV